MNRFTEKITTKMSGMNKKEMEEMKRYRITYKQRFMGEVLQDSYVRTVANKHELQQAISNLYNDPHVFSVDYELIKD